MKFFDLLKTIIADVDNQGSSKRVLLLWIGVVIWGFVHWMLFLHIKPFNTELAGTLLLYDVMLITGFGGLAIVEKIWGRGKPDKPEPPKE